MRGLVKGRHPFFSFLFSFSFHAFQIKKDKSQYLSGWTGFSTKMCLYRWNKNNHFNCFWQTFSCFVGMLYKVALANEGLDIEMIISKCSLIKFLQFHYLLSCFSDVRCCI